MQLLMNSPNLLDSAAARRIPEIGRLAGAYTSAQNQQVRVVPNIGGQLLRNALSVAGQVSREGMFRRMSRNFSSICFKILIVCMNYRRQLEGIPHTVLIFNLSLLWN